VESILNKSGIGRWIWLGSIAAAILILSAPVYAAEDEGDPQVRIRNLEKQMQLMAEQLKALQEQLARDVQPAATAATPIVKSVVSNPVEASFKNGLVLRDASGDWALRLYARAQLDYRHFSPDEFSADTFSMRRARIGTIATFFEDFT